jgi:hypothetical protein
MAHPHDKLYGYMHEHQLEVWRLRGRVTNNIRGGDHLRERPEGSGNWSIVVDVGEPDPRTSKKKRKWHSFKGTKREAQKEAARLITALTEGKYVEPSKVTVAAYFERWLAHGSPRSLRKLMSAMPRF